MRPATSARSWWPVPRQAATKQQGGLSFGSSGAGTTTHLAGELLALRHVPYKGGGQAVTDVAGGQISLIHTVIPTIAGFIKNGRLRPIAVSSAKRSDVLPEVPTMIKSGLPGFEVSSWYGLLAPAKTPKAIVERIQREVHAVLQLPEATGLSWMFATCGQIFGAVTAN